MKKLLFLFFVLLFSAKINLAQVYKISDYNGKTLNVCKGQFVSSLYTNTNDGINGVPGYNNNENYTVTFCSGDPTRQLRVNFYYVNLEANFDFLYVYDGSSATGTPIATLTNYSLFPGVFTSSGQCLTFKFVSDAYTAKGGWGAFIGCTPISCGVNQPASDECITATPICNLGGYCGTTSGWYTRGTESVDLDDNPPTGTKPFCGVIHNNSWLSFIASTSNASFDITSSHCSDPSLGIQAVMFQTNDCKIFSRVSTTCENAKGNFKLNAVGLTIGKKYYIMIDGAYGNDCDYTILAKSGVQTVNITASSTNTLCTGQPLVVTANATGIGPFTYKWSPKPLSANSDSSVVTYPATVGATYSCSVTGVCGTPTSVSYTPSVDLTPTIVATDSAQICTGGNGTVLTVSSPVNSPTIYFANNVTTSIPDTTAAGVTSTISVGNISGIVGTDLQQVCMDISHGSDSELDISLKSPNGKVIDLSSGNGAKGSNYTKTCFVASGAPSITTGAAPFTGTYLPEQAFSNLSGSSINGKWTLIVKDTKLDNTGLLTGWSITFKNGLTYSWAPSTGLSGTGTTVNANPVTTTVYTATVTDKAGCAASKPVKVKVTATPAAPAVSSPVIYCINSTASPLSALGSNLLWYTTANGGTGSSVAPTPVTTASGSFDYYVSDRVDMCEGKRSKITVVVNSKLDATFSYTSASFCQNAGNPLPVLGTGAVAGIFKATPAGLVFVNNSTGEINLKASTPGTYSIVNELAPVGGCATVTSVPFIITIHPEPSLNNSSTAEVCSGVQLNIPLISTVPSTYNWIANDNTNVTGENYITSKQSAVINDVLINNTTVPQIVKYVITLTSTAGGCINLKPQTIDVTVNPEPYLTNVTADSVCSGTPLHIILKSNVTSAYSWVASDNANTTGETNTPQQTAVINDVIINNTTVPQVVQYTVILTGTVGGCVNIKPQTIEVTINPEPILTNTSAVSVCSGKPLHIALTSTVDVSYSWIAGDNKNTTGETYISPKQTSLINDLLVNTTTVPQVVTYTVTLTSSSGACSNLKPQLVTVTVNPEPVITNSSVNEICSGNALNISLSSSVPCDFNWIAAENKSTTGETYLASKSTNLINDVLVNNSNIAQVVSYSILLTSKLGCVNLTPQTINITVNKTVADFTASPLKGEMPLEVQFSNNSASTGVTNYIWDFGNGENSTDINPNHIYTQTGRYEACLVNDNGKCSDKKCITIEVEIHSAFVIPNVFTPNNDGVNDVFTIAGKGIESMHAEIFNRWGQKEYEWNTINGGWDGHSASGSSSAEGTYYFILEIKGLDGKQYSESGSLTLLR
jgi:gliding motility-associated-like protein